MKNYRYIVLGLLMSWTLGVSARTYVAGEKVYVNVNQSDGLGNWSSDYAKLFLYFFQSTNADNNEWVTLEPVRAGSWFYVGTLQANHTWYDRVSVVRKDPAGTAGNWDYRWNQSCDIIIPDNGACTCNFLNEFYKKANLDDNCVKSYDWKAYAPHPEAIPSVSDLEADGVTVEQIKVCESAWGGPFSLWVKLNDTKTAYNYSDVKGHGWYSSIDGTTWTALQPEKTDVALDGLDDEIQMNKNNLPFPKPVSGEIYYFLHSSIPSGRRLIHVTTDALQCDLDCSITSFETAISNVNADDNTYTLDGMVAFGKASGSLVISCGTASITIPTPESPQAFSLNNLPATDKSGQIATVTASFTGDGDCHEDVDFGVPNIVEAVEIIRKDILTGDAISLLSPTADASNDYIWVDDNDVEHTKAGGQTQSYDVSAFAKDDTAKYTYKEYYELSGTMKDLMATGNYESGTPLSDYDNWGTFPQTNSEQINFYENDAVNPSHYKDNGFAIVRNAHNFYPTYAAVTAKQGSNFALFDAKTGEDGGNKKAWYATTADNSDLKLKEGTVYVLSFWAANINNYGEMDNAARFKFYVEDITDPSNPVRIDSSEVLDLSIPKFRNNIWHQCSETFYAKKNCNNVRISVVNLNTNELNIGNDFALDDIQFHAISTVTKVVKSYQVFEVYAHEPKIDAFTATVVPLPCDGGPAYTVKMHVTFQNPKGNLIIHNKTTGVDSVYTVSAPWDTPTDFDRDFTITTDEPTHEWEAYFEDWTSAKKTTTTAIPGFPKIEAKNYRFSDPIPTCGTLTTLTFDLDYTYQQGTLHYSIDGISGEKTKAITTDKSKQTLKDLTFEGIPADGQVRTLHVSFDGANSCTKDFLLTLPTTFSPKIDDVQILGLPTGKLSCDTTSYEITVQVTTHYDATGQNIVLKYDDNGTEKSVTVPATGSVTTKKLNLHNMDKGAQTISAALEEAPACSTVVNYTAPMLARITPLFDVNVSETACDVLNYTVSGTVNYDMADGNLIVEYDATHRQVISVAPGSTSANFSIPNMTDSGDALTLTAWFTGSAIDPCKEVSKTFASPTVPKIDTLKVGYAPVGCTDVNTTLTFDLDYTYQQGTLTYWVDAMTGSKQTATYNIAKAKADTLKGLTFANIPADGKAHTLHVSFDGSNSCKKTYTLPAAPFSPVIDAVVITSTVPTLVTCETTSYDVAVEVTTHYDASGKQVQLTYNDNGSPVTSAPITISGKKGTTTITLHNIANGTHTIDAAFVATPTCTISSAPYTAPSVAQIKDFTVATTARACDDAKYSISGSIPFDMADGNLIVFYDATHADTILAPVTSPAAFTINNMTADGEGLTVTAKFSKSESCTKTATFDAPVKPIIDTLHVGYAAVGCTDVNTTLTFDLDYTYQQGTLTYWVDAMTGSKQTATYTIAKAKPDTLKGLTFANIPADGKAHTLHVSFDGSNSCVKDYTLPAAPFSPVIDAVVITSTVPTLVTCETTSYDVAVEVTTHYDASGKQVQLTYTDNGAPVTSAPITISGKKGTTTITLHNIANGTHTIDAAFVATPTCTISSAPYTAPSVAQIKDFTVATTARACDDAKYSISGSIPFDMADGNLIVFYDATHADTILAPVTSPAAFTINNMTADGEGLTVTAKFSKSESCTKTATFDAPVKPTIDTLKVGYAPVGCTDVNTTLTFDLDYTYQQGTLTYWVDAMTGSKQTATYTIAKAKADTLKGLTFTNIPADGKTHVLHVSFDGSNSCVKDYTLPAAPFSPVIDAVVITSTVPTLVTCETTSYDVAVEVTTHYDASGKQVQLTYTDNGAPVTSAPITISGKKGSTTITLHNIANGTHTIDAAFVATPTCTISSAPYTAPSVAQIKDFTVATTARACDDAKYSISGSIPFDMADGNLIVFYDATHADTILAPVTSPAAFTINNMTADGEGLTVTAKFSKSESCTKTATFDAPVKPTIDTLKVGYAPVGCTDVNTTLTFDLDYTYQQGTLTYWVDAMTGAKQTATYTIAKAKPDTLKGLTFTNIPADGKTHVLHVSFDGSNSCVKDYTLPAAPFSPVINKVQISGVPATVLCDEMSYTATVSVSMLYDATGKNIVLTYEGTSKTVAVSGNPTVTTLTLTTTDASGLTISAAYADSPACTTLSDSYTAPSRWNCIKDQVTVCEGESYTWSVTGLTYGPFNTIGKDTIASSINVYDSLFVTVQSQPEISILDIDTLYDDITVIRVPYVVTKGTPNKFVCTVNGVVSTHAKTAVDTIVIAKPASVTTGDYTIDIEVIDSTFGTCHTTVQKKVHIAGIPSVSTLTVTPREIACGGSSYEVEVHAVYQNPRSALLVKDKTNGVTYTYIVPTVTTVPYNTPQTIDTVITIASMTPATLAWEALFAGWTGSNATSVAPTVPSMQINAVTPSAPACSKMSDVTFNVDYIYQQGQMQYKVDGMAAQTQAITPKNAGSLNSGTLTVSNVPADGKTHKLYVTFDGANSCQDSVTFTAPLSQVIDDVQITGVPATILCDETSYTATVSVLMPYDATGKNIVLSYEGTTKTVAVSGNPTVTTLTLTTADASGLTISAAYSDSPACSTTSSSYTAPTRLTCDRDSADICVGESYLWHGTSFSPAAAGTYGYKDNYDSLYMTVHAEPAVTMLPAAMICADENEIRLPFAVTSGTPNKFDIAIGGHTFTKAAGLTDTIVIARPSDIPAGSYTATVTVRDSLVNCFTTAKTSFVIAAPDLMYRKWNDVVFVDNSSKQFVSYQWYESVSGALNGETQQYLHDGTSLSGTYYCRIVTTANDTLYTCPIAFDDITPSRDVANGSSRSVSVTPTYVRSSGTISVRQEEAQELTIMVYNATGSLTGMFTQNEKDGTIKAPAQNGVYVVHIYFGESVHTTKIIVHE